MKPPFKCGQCGAKALYRDDDIVNKLSWIACMTCGNRYPGGFKPIEIGEEDMANKKGTCTNCERADLVIANAKGHCSTCHGAGKGLEGEDLRIALVNTKFRIRTKLEGLGRTETEKELPEIKTKPLPPTSIAKARHCVDRLKARHDPDNEIITLIFESEIDKALLKSLKDRAATERRTVDQQALFMLQSNLPEPRGLCPPPQTTSSISQEA